MERPATTHIALPCAMYGHSTYFKRRAMAADAAPETQYRLHQRAVQQPDRFQRYGHAQQNAQLQHTSSWTLQCSVLSRDESVPLEAAVQYHCACAPHTILAPSCKKYIHNRSIVRCVWPWGSVTVYSPASPANTCSPIQTPYHLGSSEVKSGCVARAGCLH
jgi:hypothetical protein